MVSGKKNLKVNGKKYPGPKKLVFSSLLSHLILHLLHDATVYCQHISVGEGVSTVRAKEGPFSKVN